MSENDLQLIQVELQIIMTLYKCHINDATALLLNILSKKTEPRLKTSLSKQFNVGKFCTYQNNIISIH